MRNYSILTQRGPFYVLHLIRNKILNSLCPEQQKCMVRRQYKEVVRPKVSSDFVRA